jgi:hypothetical protein
VSGLLPLIGETGAASAVSATSMTRNLLIPTFRFSLSARRPPDKDVTRARPGLSFAGVAIPRL